MSRLTNAEFAERYQFERDADVAFDWAARYLKQRALTMWLLKMKQAAGLYTLAGNSQKAELCRTMIERGPEADAQSFR